VDPDFLAAISGKNDVIEINADELKKLRDFVLHGGDLPRRKHQAGSSSDRSPQR
jgi:hypothetical protein